MVLNIKYQKVGFEKNFRELIINVEKWGDDLYREIDLIISRKKIEISEIKNVFLIVFIEYEDEIVYSLFDIK